MTLREYAISHQLRTHNREVVRPGGEAIQQQPPGTQESLMVTAGGTVYPVFILGQSDIDSTKPLFYIP